MELSADAVKNVYMSVTFRSVVLFNMSPGSWMPTCNEIAWIAFACL